MNNGEFDEYAEASICFMNNKPHMVKYLRNNGIILNYKPTSIEMDFLLLLEKYINIHTKREKEYKDKNKDEYKDKEEIEKDNKEEEEEEEDEEDNKNSESSGSIDIFKFIERFKKLFWKAQQYNRNLKNIIDKAKKDFFHLKNDFELERILIILEALKRKIKIITLDQLKQKYIGTANNKDININKDINKDINKNLNNVNVNINNVKDMGILAHIKTLVSSPEGIKTYLKSFNGEITTKWNRIKEIFNRIVSVVKSIMPNINFTDINTHNSNSERGNTKTRENDVNSNENNNKKDNSRTKKQEIKNNSEITNNNHNNKTTDGLTREPNSNDINNDNYINNDNGINNNNRNNNNPPLSHNPNNPLIYDNGGKGNYANGDNGGGDYGKTNDDGGNDLNGNGYIPKNKNEDDNNNLGNANTQTKLDNKKESNELENNNNIENTRPPA